MHSVARPEGRRRSARPCGWPAPAPARRPAIRACSFRGQVCRTCRGSRAVAPNAGSLKTPHAGRGRCRRSTAPPRRRCGRTNPRGPGRNVVPCASGSAVSWAVEAFRISFPIPMSSTAKVPVGDSGRRLRVARFHLGTSPGVPRNATTPVRKAKDGFRTERHARRVAREDTRRITRLPRRRFDFVNMAVAGGCTSGK